MLPLMISSSSISDGEPLRVAPGECETYLLPKLSKGGLQRRCVRRIQGLVKLRDRTAPAG